jgi:phosphohistidine phosphatase
MKRLILLRHAKSDWDADYGADRERPLNTRGEKAAAVMGRLLTAAGEVPDAIISSPAVRARTTAEVAAAAGEWSTAINVRDELYGASPNEVVSVIREMGGTAERLLVVGHEPTTSQTVSMLSGGRVRVATATAVAVDLGPDDWKRLEPGAATIAYVLPPRLFS